jgi:ABC-type antimicrobial peptide transport system permease subunit
MGSGDLITVAAMVIQLVGGFIAGKTLGIQARKFIPLANGVLSIATQLLAAFSTGLGPAPVAAPAVAMASIFGSFGNTFLDILVKAVLQTWVVTGAHSSVKNTTEGVKLATAK